MKRLTKIALTGLLVGSLTLGVNGCNESKENLTLLALPNNYQTAGILQKSIAHEGSDNIFSNESDLVKKSIMRGEVSYIGFAENEGDISGDEEVIIKIKTYGQGYIFSLKDKNDLLNPSIILQKFEVGDLISVPTIRKYERIDSPFRFAKHGYRILNEIDYIYLHEILENN